ncbi:MAG: AbrB/MazE/SpoVT family DNA-binding domain-containing protein [Spirochaetes bacterium]|nr:AbrB/MazE/SpoVT family DNA-binding domain-containing protein [Spirochaetota bacterium]
MEVTVKKWGNSLGIRIPRAIAKDLNLRDGAAVEIEDRDGSIVISPRKTTLADMLSKVDAHNIHGEVDFGESAGKEAW